MPSLLETLDAPDPALWIEVSPPRGINTNSLLGKLANLSGHVGAINLTDNSLGKVKMSGLVFGSMIKSRLSMPVVLNVSCRDRNRLALTSDLLGAAAMGIDAVVALTGDKLPPAEGGHGTPVSELDAMGLLRLIGDLNRGDTGEGKRLLKTLPALLPGAVANPNRVNLEREFDLLRRKAESGARFVITQPVFEVDTALRFLAKADEYSLKVVLGILPIKRESMATYLKERVKDLSAVSHHFDRYSGMSEEQAREASRGFSLDLMKQLEHAAAGFNIMSGGGPSLAIELALAYSQRRTGGSGA